MTGPADQPDPSDPIAEILRQSTRMEALYQSQMLVNRAASLSVESERPALAELFERMEAECDASKARLKTVLDSITTGEMWVIS